MLKPNDPKLTAFALDELEPAEYAQVAKSVVESPELQSEVAQIRQLGEELESLLSQEPCPGLETGDREPILEAAGTMATRLETPSPKSSKIYSPSAQFRSAWLRRHRKLVYATAALLLTAVTLLLVVPLTVRLTEEPHYVASAWIRAEEIHVIYRSVPRETSDVEVEGVSPPFPREKSEVKTLVQPISQLYSRIVPKEVEQELLKARTQALEEQINQQVIEIDPEEIEREIFSHPSIVRLEKEKGSLVKRQQQILAESGGDRENPRYRTLAKLLSESTQNRVEQIVKLRGQLKDEKIAAEMEKREDAIKQAKKQIASNQLEIDLMRENFFAQRDSVKHKSRESMELLYKKKELQREESIVELISARIMRLRTEMQAPAKVTLLRKAEPPTEPIERGWFSFWSSGKPSKASKQHSNVAAGGGHHGYERNSVAFLRKQVQLIKSPLVLEPVLARPDVASYQPLANHPQPVAWLAERIQVFKRENSELLIIEFTCADPKYAAIITNAIVESYFRMHTQEDAQRSTRVVDLLEDERARRMVIIQQLQEQLNEMRARAAGKHGDAQIHQQENLPSNR